MDPFEHLSRLGLATLQVATIATEGCEPGEYRVSFNVIKRDDGATVVEQTIVTATPVRPAE